MEDTEEDTIASNTSSEENYSSSGDPDDLSSDEDYSDIDLNLTEKQVHPSMVSPGGPTMSCHECSIAILSIANKHNMSYSSTMDVLNLFTHILPSNSAPPSYHMIMKELLNYQAYTTVHRCCGFCTRLLSTDSSCLQPECQLAKIPDSTFVEVHIANQLQVLFSGT